MGPSSRSAVHAVKQLVVSISGSATASSSEVSCSLKDNDVTLSVLLSTVIDYTYSTSTSPENGVDENALRCKHNYIHNNIYDFSKNDFSNLYSSDKSHFLSFPCRM